MPKRTVVPKRTAVWGTVMWGTVMSRVMRTLGAVGLVAVLTATACSRATGGSAGAWPADRTFHSTAVTEGSKPRPLVSGTRIELSFYADGRLDARAGCNHLGGDGRIEDGKLVMGEMSMTEMACDPERMQQDTWLSTFLGSRPEWALAGTELRLRGGDVAIVLADRRVADPDRALVGPRWVVDTIITGDAASSVPAGVAAFLTFAGDGSVLGHTGCRAIRGQAAVTGTVIKFSSVGGLDGSCTGDAATLHDAVARVVGGEVSYRIEGPLLTLTAAGGGLRLRAET